MSILRYMINEKVGNQVGNAIFQGRNFGMPYHSDSLLHMRDFIIGKRVLFHTTYLLKIVFLARMSQFEQRTRKMETLLLQTLILQGRTSTTAIINRFPVR